MGAARGMLRVLSRVRVAPLVAIVACAGCGSTMQAGLATVADAIGVPGVASSAATAATPDHLMPVAMQVGRAREIRALLAPGGLERHPTHGAVELWYAADGAVLRLHGQGSMRGALIGVHDGQRQWDRLSPLPSIDWRAVHAGRPHQHEQVSDEMPGHRMGLRRSVTVVALPEPPGLADPSWRVAAVRGASRAQWFEESLVPTGPQATQRPGAPGGQAWYAVDLGREPAQVLAVWQCLAVDWCLGWRPPPVAATPAASTGR